jgi:phosphohistidine phosphatase
MKTLTLLRHAKSGWDDPVQRDFDRPLSARGRRAAARMGRYLNEAALSFDAVIASPAVRVRETVEGLEDGSGRMLSPLFDARIYMASAATLFDVLQGFDDRDATVLLVGHNPGLEDLVLLSVPEDAGGLRADVEAKYPTATLAELQFDVERWADVGEDGARFVRFVRPRDLDPALGPDD